MKTFTTLCTVSLKGLLMTNAQHRKAGKKAASGIGIIVLTALVCLYISGTYSFLLAGQLAPLGGADLVYVLMALMSVVGSFLFCAFSAAGFLFGGKDTALLLSLPVSSFVLVLSRVAALYLENLCITLFFLLPAAIAVVINGGAAGVCAAFFVPVVLLLPLLSCVGSLILAFLVSLFERRGRYQTLIRTLLYLVFFAALMIGSLRLNSSLGQIASNIDALRSGLLRYAIPFYWVRDCLADGSISALGKLALLCILSFLAITALFARFYKRLFSKLESRTARSDYRLQKLQRSSVRQALYKKELYRYVNCTMYLFNTCIGMLMLLGAGIYAMVMRQTVRATLSQVGLSASALLPMAALVLGFMIAMTCVTAPGISLESNRLWILKESPIRTGDIFEAKLALQLTVTVPALAISCVLFCAALQFSPLEGLLLFLLGSFASLAVGIIGLLCNLKLPKLDGANDTIIVKQSASVLVAMLCGVVMTGILVGFYCLVTHITAPFAALWMVTFLLLVLSALLWRVLMTRGAKMFARLI